MRRVLLAALTAWSCKASEPLPTRPVSVAIAPATIQASASAPPTKFEVAAFQLDGLALGADIGAFETKYQALRAVAPQPRPFSGMLTPSVAAL